MDSSVAAALLVEAGYDVHGVTMEIWSDNYQPETAQPAAHACFGPGEGDDVEDARKVAEQLGIPFHSVDLHEKFEQEVLTYFRREYSRGRTPNPCILCNRRLKFVALLDGLETQDINWNYFATGHYVRREQVGNIFKLKRGRDPAKDQSYFLYTLGQELLATTLFPLGDLTKEEVRTRAEELGLEVKNKDESQDFYAGDYTELLAEEPRPGPIVNRAGEKLGEHEGIQKYTVGQRRGLGISANKPLYVLEIDAEKNALVVGDREQLYSREFLVEKVNWIAPGAPEAELEAQVKIRYRHPAAPAVLRIETDDSVRVSFQEPQRAVTPGQAAVFYDDQYVLGGGLINSPL